GVRPRWIGVLLLWPPFAQALYVGNVALPLLPLFVAAPWFGAGLVLAAIFKVYTLIAGLWLARERYWRQLALGGLGVGLALVITLPITGLDRWFEWARGLEAYQASQPPFPSTLYGMSIF